MAILRTLVSAAILAALFSGQAVAYQYGYYAPVSYSAPRSYYPPYARSPYPYYHAPHRYPVQPAYPHAKVPVSAPVPENRTAHTTVKNIHADTGKSVNKNPEAAAKTAIAESGTSNKKQAFINELLPYIEQENRRLSKLRNRVEHLLGMAAGNTGPGQSEKQQISRLASEYRVQGDPLTDSAARDELLTKIDIIPSSLALAQAANESAWGESRFAREANNLFGIWTYDVDKGLLPRNREEGKKHRIRIFDDAGESVQYYMHTLNSHPAYAQLRNLRKQQRDANQFIDGHQLAEGLEKYSAKGQQYIDLIQNLIRQNEWAELDMNSQRV